MSVVFVDSLPECAAAVAKLLTEAEVGVDVEGVDLCRHGQVCLVQVASSRGAIYLFDIVQLGQAAFTAGRLRELLESESTCKVIFDGRADNDALLHRHGFTMRNAYDLQILYALRFSSWSDRYVKGLQKCLDTSFLVPLAQRSRLQLLKDVGRHLFAPECGGRYEVWRERPLHPQLRDYAVADVQFLVAMKKLWGSPTLDPTVLQLTADRIRKAVQNPLPAKGPHMALRDFPLPGLKLPGLVPAPRRGAHSRSPTSCFMWNEDADFVDQDSDSDC